jgi:hypothetical protein
MQPTVSNISSKSLTKYSTADKSTLQPYRDLNYTIWCNIPVNQWTTDHDLQQKKLTRQNELNSNLGHPVDKTSHNYGSDKACSFISCRLLSNFAQCFDTSYKISIDVIRNAMIDRRLYNSSALLPSCSRIIPYLYIPDSFFVIDPPHLCCLTKK